MPRQSRKRAAAVQGLQEIWVDGLTPPPAPFRADLEGLGQQVFLGVDHVDEVPQGIGCVLAQPDMHVDAAGWGGVCPKPPGVPDRTPAPFRFLPSGKSG